MIKDIIEILKGVETFVVTNIYNRLINVRYKLQKNENITYKLIDAPKFRHDVDNKFDRSFKQPYAELIEQFVSTMEKNLPESSLKAMYDNLKTLKIAQTNNSIYSFFFNGTYYLGINGIILSSASRGDATVTHELLHMSSAIVGSNSCSTGFCTGTVGRNLNEGYTEVLNNRLFHYPLTSHVPYYIFSCFAYIIEDVVGKDTMTDFYFRADLKGIFEYLSFYTSKDKTNLFFYNFDSLFHNTFQPECFDKIINYLTELSINFVNDEIKKDALSFLEGDIFLQKYYDKIDFIMETVYFYLVDKKIKSKQKLVKPFNEIFHKFRSTSFELVEDNEIRYFKLEHIDSSKKSK